MIGPNHDRGNSQVTFLRRTLVWFRAARHGYPPILLWSTGDISGQQHKLYWRNTAELGQDVSGLLEDMALGDLSGMLYRF